MQRREFIKRLSFSGVGLAASPLLFNACSSEKPKNILFIMTDDHAYQAISSYGSKINKTPNIDRLAKDGVLFEQSFVTNSICGPSRAVMLTGKYSHLNGMIDNSTTFDGSQQTFVKLLRENGYLTSIIGKWHLKSEPTGFDYWNVLPGQGNYYNPDFIEMGEKKRIPGYVTDLTTDFAINWLDERDKSKPFCMLLHHKAPHRNWMPGPDHLDMYDDTEIPMPETFFDDYSTRSRAAMDQTMEIDDDMFIDYDLKVPISENEMSDFSDEKIFDGTWNTIYNRMSEEQRKKWDAAYNNENDEFKRKKLKGKELAKWKYQRYIKDYLRSIASVDDNIGRMLDYLKENNLDENTVIVYTSDQGFYLGEHGWFDKRFMYEQSHRTPLIIKVPDGLKGIVNRNDMVVNADYAPTFLDIAGVPIPKDMQGKSLKKILHGRTPEDWRDAVYYHYFEYPAEHMVKRHYGIRTSRYKLIHYYYDIDAWEFYDLENDPSEITNLYGDKQYNEIIENLKVELGKLRKQYKDTDVKKFLPKENVLVSHLGIGASIKFKHPYSPKYGGGKDSLLNGWKGHSKTYTVIDKKLWQGFEKNDMVATIDFGKTITINNIKTGFLHCLDSWIFSPEHVEFYYSNDNKSFKKIDKIKRKNEIRNTRVFREEYNVSVDNIETRYLKIHAKNIGLCPQWHRGDGKPAWIFADEIEIY